MNKQATKQDETAVKMTLAGYGEITAYRSPQDGVLVIEIDTTEATEAAGTADGAGLPRLRVYINEDPIWEHPAFDEDDLRLIRKYNDDEDNVVDGGMDSAPPADLPVVFTGTPTLTSEKVATILGWRNSALVRSQDEEDADDEAHDDGVWAQAMEHVLRLLHNMPLAGAGAPE